MNVAIVGFGSIGPVHAQALSEIKDAEIYGICDVVKERADSGAQMYDAKAFYDYDECLKDKKIDYVHICTPHYLHFEMITKALDAGKRVVCEKPAAMKKEEIEILYSKYEIKKIFPIFQNRTNNCIEKLSEIVKTDKTLGALKGLKAIVTWARGADYYSRDNWHGRKALEGGGVLINQALHTLDLMVMFGGKVKKVSSTMDNFSLKDIIDVEDTISAYLRFENGAKGVFFATNAYTRDSAVEIELHFENKTFLYEEGKLYANKELICSDSEKYVGKKYWGYGHVKTLHNLYEGASDMCLDDIKNTMDVLFAIYESAEKGSEITL